MRKRKGKKIIISLIILIILSIGTYLVLNKYYFKDKKKEKNNSTNEVMAIIKKESFSDFHYLEKFQDYYVVNKYGKVGVINSQKEVVLDFIYPAESVIFTNEDALLIEDNAKYYLYDQNLNLIISSDEEINITYDPVKQETFYITNDNLYNLEKEVIFSNINDYIDDSGDIKKIGNYLFIDYTIINLANQETFNIDYYIQEEDYIYALDQENKKLYFYDYKNDFTIYQIGDMLTNGFILNDETNNTYFLTVNHGLIKKDTVVQEKDYKLVYNCSFGFQIFTNDTLVTDTCYDDYYLNEGSKALSLIKDTSYFILNDGKIIANHFEPLIIGDYLGSYDYEAESLIVEDFNGNRIPNNCNSSLEYYDDSSYICQNFYQTALVDQDLKPISPYYDTLECLPNTPYCIFSQDNKYGLLENKKVIIEAIYLNMFYDYTKNILIGETLWGFDSYILKKTNNYLGEQDLEVKIPEPYLEVDTLAMINKYDLKEYQDLIMANREFFQKYAYIVDNNSNLGKYKDKVMNLFYVVILNQDKMNENIFLSALERLKIEKKDKLLQENANGLYYDNDKRIDLLVDSDSVIYHELMHFVSHSLNYLRKEIYTYQDQYVSYFTCQSLSLEERNNCVLAFGGDINFLTEGGAEYYAGHYFNQNVVTVYPLQTSIIGALSYIYGFDSIQDIYFDTQDGYFKLYQLFANANVSKNDFNKFLEYSSSSREYSEKDRIFITDTLIKLYEAVKNKDWTQDLEFSEIITIILGYTQIKPSYTTNYAKYLQLNYDFKQKYKNIAPDIYQKINVYPGGYVKTKDASYLILSYYNDKNGVSYRVINYDFEKQKVLDQKTVDFN